MMLTVAMSTMAMSYEQARERALFLTDKMAYELNLTDEQYEAAYEVNLDYLMSINSYDDLYGTYWTRRNLDLSYILYDWQYSTFCSAAYFYRPLIWDNGVWRFSIYARYPHRTYFYFGRPAFYVSYRGGHSWHMNGGRSWYHGRTFGPRPGESRFGMRDRFDRGDFRGSRGHGRDYDRRDNGRGYDRRDDRRDNGRGYDRRDDRRDNNKGYNRGNGRNDNTATTADIVATTMAELLQEAPAPILQDRAIETTMAATAEAEANSETTPSLCVRTEEPTISRQDRAAHVRP